MISYLGVSGVEVTEHAAGLQDGQHTKRPLKAHFIYMKQKLSCKRTFSLKINAEPVHTRRR